MGALDVEAGDPPGRHGDRRDRELQPRRQRLSGADLAASPYGVRQPERRREPDEEESRGVDAAERRHCQGERRGVAPTPVAHGLHRERDQPGQSGERQQHARQPGDQRQDHGAQRVGEGRGRDARALPAEHPEQVGHTGARGEDDRPPPQALRDPVRQPGRLGQPVEGPHRPQEADALVGHRAQPDARVPHRRRPAQQLAGVEVEVGLGVGADPAGPGHQQRKVGDCSQSDMQTEQWRVALHPRVSHA